MTSIKHPNVCDLCGKDISKEDRYYAGVTRGDILAYTCMDYDCKKWLVRRVLINRILGEQEGKVYNRSGGKSY